VRWLIRSAEVLETQAAYKKGHTNTDKAARLVKDNPYLADRGLLRARTNCNDVRTWRRRSPRNFNWKFKAQWHCRGRLRPAIGLHLPRHLVLRKLLALCKHTSKKEKIASRLSVPSGNINANKHAKLIEHSAENYTPRSLYLVDGKLCALLRRKLLLLLRCKLC
jgi:hypothetical protein